MTDMEFSLTLRQVSNELIQTADARALHAYLENGDHFATWIKDRIEQYGFTENVDYVTFSGKSEKGGRPPKEYALTLNMAKELSMVERNEKGRQARKYFLECERFAHEAVRQLTAPVAPDLDEVKRAEAIIAQRDICVAHHLNEVQRLTGKAYRAVKPRAPRKPKELAAPDDKTRQALDGLLGLTLQLDGADKTVRELLAIALDNSPGVDLKYQGVVTNTLRLAGIIVDGNMLVFGTSVPFLQSASEQLFADPKGLRPFLIAVPGAVRVDRTLSFSGTKSKVVRVPLSAVFTADLEM